MITIASHYNGPDGIGHGGVSAGRFAELVDADAARVRFRRPVPLDRALDTSTADDGGAEVLHDGEQVAVVEPLDGSLDVGAFAMPSELDIGRAERRWLDPRDGMHMAPACFACGHRRDLGGLGLRPGETTGGVFACRWHPEGEGPVPAWLVWAALDCPTGFPAFMTVGADHAVVTGELAVEVLAPVDAGRTHVVLSRVVSRSGRRNMTEAALCDTDGRRLAVATAVWVTVPIAAVLGPAAGAA